ncbi:MAG: glycosyltransferase family 2 protein, partial [Sulfurospirillum sp.]
LDSIADDPFPDKEVVIINDGSTDNTDSVIREWIGKNGDRVQITYKSQPNQGLTKTLNTLLSLASGEYLVTLASDDFLLPGGLEKRLGYLRNHPEKYAVFADCIVVDQQGNQTHDSGLFSLRHADKAKLLTDEGIKEEFISNFAVPGPVLMVKRDFYTRFGNYNEEMYMEDYDLYLKFAAQNLIGFLDEKVSAYRLHESNMSAGSSSNFIKLLEDSRKTLKLHWNDFQGYHRWLLAKEIAKFTIRIQLQRIKNYSAQRQSA